MAVEDLAQMRFDGTFEGRRRPSSEWRVHRDLLAARPDVSAVLHRHSVHATMIARHHRTIPSCPDRVAVAGGTMIRRAPDATFGTQALSDNAVEALRHRLACLLGRRGQIAPGKTIEAAPALATEAETLARLYVRALTPGRTARAVGRGDGPA